MTFEDIQQFEMDIGRAKFDPNEDTDGLPMIETRPEVIEHIFKNAVNLSEVPYVIYKDVKVYVKGSYAEVKAKEKIKPGSQGTLTAIPLDSQLAKGDGLHDVYEGEVL